MKILLTGSSGRIGRAIFGALAGQDEVVGFDRNPFATTRFVGNVTNSKSVRDAMSGVDAVIHTASLHAPHVGVETDDDFTRVNIHGLNVLISAMKDFGTPTLVYTSTTALYGHAIEPDQCTWIDESTRPIPKTIYHHSKLEAEAILEDAANKELAVRILRMSRCFPEPANQMAVYCLHRGIDVRDAADAHVAALRIGGESFQRYVVSGRTPFERDDVHALATDARAVLMMRCPELVDEFERRGSVPRTIDRVYDATVARKSLGWEARYNFNEVISQHDRRSIEVLPCAASSRLSVQISERKLGAEDLEQKIEN